MSAFPGSLASGLQAALTMCCRSWILAAESNQTEPFKKVTTFSSNQCPDAYVVTELALTLGMMSLMERKMSLTKWSLGALSSHPGCWPAAFSTHRITRWSLWSRFSPFSKPPNPLQGMRGSHRPSQTSAVAEAGLSHCGFVGDKLQTGWNVKGLRSLDRAVGDPG